MIIFSSTVSQMEKEKKKNLHEKTRILSRGFLNRLSASQEREEKEATLSESWFSMHKISQAMANNLNDSNSENLRS